ncbi:hypothetical protein KCU67_g5250, partial [Aureobasidium melanogenum]
MPRLRQAVKVKKKSNGLKMRDLKRNEDIEPMEQPKSVVEVPFTYPSYTLTSKAALPTCPETCKVCAQHYLPKFAVCHPIAPRAMVPYSDTEAAQTTADYVKRINDDRDAIRAKLKMYGDLLLKRWQRKSIEKRATVVRTAMPEIYSRRFQSARLLSDNKRAFAQHYSTISIKKFKARGAEQCMTDSMQALKLHNDSHRKQQLLPFIDIETLSQDYMSLLALLHHRSGPDITDWVMHDFEHLRAALIGRWDHLLSTHTQSAHRHDIIGFPRAVLILEAQATLFAFLCKTVEILLEPSIQGATVGHQQWDVLVQSDFGKIGPKPLVGRRLEAFRSPPRLDMATIVETLVTQTEIMFDELWLQQTDPLYLRAHLVQAKDSELHDRMAKESREEWVLEFALCYSVWADNFQTALDLAVFVFKMQEDLGRGKNMEQMFQGQLRDLRCLVIQEKPFRDYFENLGRGGELKVKLSPEKMLLANPMLWNMIQLYTRSESHSSTFHLAFIDHIMREDAKNEKNRISPLLATHIASMIAVDDIMSSLRYHRPQHGVSVDAEMLAELVAELPRTLPERQQQALGCMYAYKGFMWPKLEAFMNLPPPPSEEPYVLLKYLRPLDEALHQFWQWACVSFFHEIERSGQSLHLYSDPMFLTMIGTMQIERARRALWYANLERVASEQEGSKQVSATQPISAASVSSTPLQTTWGEAATPAFIRPAAKSKLKTRPSYPTSPPTDSMSWNTDPVAPPPSPQAFSILVSSKSLTLFVRMFTADPSTPGEIYWTDFVSAMADAGCSVMPGGGSCFTFTHVDEKEQKHSMVFHCPHPEPSMSKERLRSFGSRLNRRWGWSEATFAVKV